MRRWNEFCDGITIGSAAMEYRDAKECGSGRSIDLRQVASA